MVTVKEMIQQVVRDGNNVKFTPDGDNIKIIVSFYKYNLVGNDKQITSSRLVMPSNENYAEGFALVIQELNENVEKSKKEVV